VIQTDGTQPAFGVVLRRGSRGQDADVSDDYEVYDKQDLNVMRAL
jgi:hypothetical protein